MLAPTSTTTLPGRTIWRNSSTSPSEYSPYRSSERPMYDVVDVVQHLAVTARLQPVELGKCAKLILRVEDLRSNASWRAASRQVDRVAVFISANTLAQSPGRRLPEQPHRRIPGAIAAVCIQRHSGAAASASHTGTPKPPARCAAAVSEVTIRSRLHMTAAVSIKAPASVSKRTAQIDGVNRPSSAESCSTPAFFCRLINCTPSTSANGRTPPAESSESDRTNRRRFPAKRCPTLKPG